MKILLYVSLGLIVACALLLAYGYRVYSAKGWKDADRALIKIGKTEIIAEVAASALKKQKGLSGRDPLQEKEGMLFIFSKPHRYPFWMHEMKFALDFIWIRDGRIVDVSQNVPPPKPGGFELPKTVAPAEPADMVLEVSAGSLDSLDIQKGDAIDIEKI